MGLDQGQGEQSHEQGETGKYLRVAKPIAEIVNGIEKEKIKKANDQLQLIQKLRNYVI